MGKNGGIKIFFSAGFALLSPDSPATIHFLTTEDGRHMMIRGNSLFLPYSHSHSVSVSENHNKYPITAFLSSLLFKEEKGIETSMCGCLSCALRAAPPHPPHWGPSLQPRLVL